MMKNGHSEPVARRGRRGVALLVALWVLMLLTLLISAFAFDMHIEATVTSYYRKRFKSQYLARAGVEYAKVILLKSAAMKEEQQTSPVDDSDPIQLNSSLLNKGLGILQLRQDLGEGFFVLDVIPEEGRRNINKLQDDDWEEILDQANIPEDQWSSLIDCFADWTDENEEHRLNGAESDDAFYISRGYKVKNAPLNTVEELMLIKGFSPAILYGGTISSGSDKQRTVEGIARLLTPWGDGKVNVNTATRDVLLTLPGIEDFMVREIINGRRGADGVAGTKDDGFSSVDEVMSRAGLPDSVKDKITTTDRRFVRVVSVGQVKNVRSGVWCVLELKDGKVSPVFWREETMH